MEQNAAAADIDLNDEEDARLSGLASRQAA
jgi:hypothetical protein